MGRCWVLLVVACGAHPAGHHGSHRASSAAAKGRASALARLKEARAKAQPQQQQQQQQQQAGQPQQQRQAAAPRGGPSNPFGAPTKGMFAGATSGGLSLAAAARLKSLGTTAAGGAASGTSERSPWSPDWVTSAGADAALRRVLGPWKIAYHDGRERCDWRIVNSQHITPLHLWHHLFGEGGPLLVRGFLSDRWDDVGKWRAFFDDALGPERLLARHGDQSVRVAPPPAGPASPTLREWADRVWRNASVLDDAAARPPAVWQPGPDAREAADGRWSFVGPLITDAPTATRWPVLLRPFCLDRNASEFIVNPFLGGAPFHAHGPVVNLQVKGKRLWLAAHDDDAEEVRYDAVHPTRRPAAFRDAPRYVHALDRLSDVASNTALLCG